MAQTFLRGLKLLETVDFHGPLTISQLARHLGVDKATASRMVSACEPDGWLVRDQLGIRIGPRSAMLGQGEIAGQSLRAADPLVHAISGVTGLLAQAVGLIGRHGVVLASASSHAPALPYGLTTRFPLWLSAGGKTVSAQLSAEQLDRLLPPDPFPSPSEVIAEIAPPTVIGPFLTALGLDGTGPVTPPPAEAAPTAVSDRAGLDAQLEGIRRYGLFLDHAETVPGVSCLAVPWPRPGLPAALLCTATSAVILEQRPLIERVLRAAAEPAATRESVVAAAANR